MSFQAGDRASVVTPAKINLTLRITGRRADGYHELESVAAKITLYDGIDLLPGSDSAIQIECSNPAVPTDSRNTIWHAVELLAARAGILPALRLRLHKCIPLGAGLGGGSSDAAAVLQLLNRIWALGLPQADLARIAAAVGSDVPMFLECGAVCVSGRGEIIERVHLPWCGWLVLALPPFGVSTAAAYRAWTEQSARPGFGPRDCLDPSCDRAAQLEKVLFNDLETAVFAIEPRLRAVRDSLQQRSGRKFHMTGSGSTLFACLDSHEEAQMLNHSIEQHCEVRSLVTRVIASQHNE